jgi:predicted ArsR family transcriptional regulator
MDTPQIDGKKSFKKQLFETIHSRLDNSLIQYKELLGEKKMKRFLKSTSKELVAEINKRSKKAEKRQERLQKKAEKIKAEKLKKEQRA